MTTTNNNDIIINIKVFSQPPNSIVLDVKECSDEDEDNQYYFNDNKIHYMEAIYISRRDKISRRDYWLKKSLLPHVRTM